MTSRKNDVFVNWEKSPEMAEVVLSYRPKVRVSELVHISDSKGIADYLRQVWSPDMEYREEFKVLMLNRSNRIVGWVKTSSGSQSGTVADPKMVFQAALLSHAAGIILAHNHPSGNRIPSQADIALTRKIKEGAKNLDISLLDHIIMTAESYYSMADEGDIY